MSKILLTSDWHFTDNPEDDYRWKIFNWLQDIIEREKIECVFFLGDLTEKKDKHSEIIVNNVIKGLNSLINSAGYIVLLRGNHDYIEVTKPFFRFTGTNHNLLYINDITIDNDMIFLPHTRNPIEDWKDINFSKYKYVFMHQTVTGAKAANGFQLESSIPRDYFSKYKCTVFSGDIHTPQVLDNLIYVGSPYQVYYGDGFDGRVLILDSETDYIEELKPNFLKKWRLNIDSINMLEEQFGPNGIQPGDYLKIRYTLSKTEFNDMDQIKTKVRTICKSNDVTLSSIEIFPISEGNNVTEVKQVTREEMTHKDLIQLYGSKESLDFDILNFGVDLISNYKNNMVTVSCDT